MVYRKMLTLTYYTISHCFIPVSYTHLKFADEIVPVPVKVKKEIVDFVTDEGPRAGTTAESLAKLKCCSGKEGGLVTAGNASGINDGAAAVSYTHLIPEHMRCGSTLIREL